jgi:hypothetical protein
MNIKYGNIFKGWLYLSEEEIPHFLVSVYLI